MEHGTVGANVSLVKKRCPAEGNQKMAIVIDLAPDLENQIRQAAAQEGLSPDAYILESITERLHQTQPQPSRVKRLSKIEASLLQKINYSLSQIEWMRYRELIAKRQAETLTSEEQTALIAFSDRIEEANVKRIQYLAELAQLRGTTIRTLLEELGLKRVVYA